MSTDVSETGEVTIEGHKVGNLVGLAFEPDSNASTLEGKTLRSAAMQALAPVIAERLKAIAGAPETALSLNDGAQIVWNEAPIAQLHAGPHWLAPSAKLMGGQDAEAHQQDAAQTRVNEWLGAEIQKRLPTHFKLKFSPDETGLEGLGRGLAFRLLEAGAACDLRGEDRALLPGPDDRTKLKEAGIRSGRIAAHIPDAQKPAAQRLIALLQTLADGRDRKTAPEGAGSFELDGYWPDEDLAAQGYLRFGKRAVRADLAERLGWELSKRRKEADQAKFEIPPELASMVSCPLDDFHNVLKGFRIAPAEKDPETGAVKLWRFQSKAHMDAQEQRRAARKQTRNKPSKGGPRNRNERSSGKPRGQHQNRRPAQRQPDPNSPFAALAALLPEQPKPKPKPKKRKPKKPKPDAEASAESNAVAPDAAPVADAQPAPETPNE